MKERPAAIALVWTFPLQRILQSFNRDQTDQSGFTCEETGLAPALIVGRKAEEVKSCAAANESCDSVIRKAFVVFDRRGILINRRTVFSIADQKTSCNSTKRHQPVGIR